MYYVVDLTDNTYNDNDNDRRRHYVQRLSFSIVESGLGNFNIPGPGRSGVPHPTPPHATHHPTRRGVARMKISRIFLCAFVFIHPNSCKPAALAMRIVVQRVKSASVVVEGQKVSQIGPGIMALVGLHEHDTDADLEYCCKRLVACKLWDNDNGGMWRHSVKQKGLSCLLVSQFTLYGTLSKKNQPDYKRSMKAAPARKLYGQFVEMVRDQYEAEKVKDGVFGAMMDVELINDGPVTIIIESTPTQATSCTQDLPSPEEHDR